MHTKLKLGYISEKYMAEIIAATGTEEIMDKNNRPYIGLYDTASDWFIPLRANINQKSPDFNHFLTPFETNNPHFKNPGLDFKKAIYVPDEKNVSEIKNTLPEKQWDFIKENTDAINKKFVDYALLIDKMPQDSREKEWSTVPLFPDGIKSIKERQFMILQNQRNRTRDIGR